MEITAINHDGPQIVNGAYVLHVKHNGRLIALEVSAANELVIKMGPANKVIEYVAGILVITAKE